MTAAVSRRCGAGRRSIPTRRPVPPARRTGFRLLIRTMIRHAPHPGAVTAVSFGVHGAATRGCLMTATSLPLPLAAGVPCAASHAINLAPIAPPANKNLRAAAGTQEHSAGRFVITCGQTCSTHASITLRVSWFRQYRDLRQFLSAGPEGILTTTGFRGCPVGPSSEFRATWRRRKGGPADPALAASAPFGPSGSLDAGEAESRLVSGCRRLDAGSHRHRQAFRLLSKQQLRLSLPTRMYRHSHGVRPTTSSFSRAKSSGLPR